MQSVPPLVATIYTTVLEPITRHSPTWLIRGMEVNIHAFSDCGSGLLWVFLHPMPSGWDLFWSQNRICTGGGI